LPGVAARGFVDLTPSELQGRLWVARAWTPDLGPLIFGTGYELAGVGSVNEPHPLA
jgi:hypothetical protein